MTTLAETVHEKQQKNKDKNSRYQITLIPAKTIFGYSMPEARKTVGITDLS